MEKEIKDNINIGTLVDMIASSDSGDAFLLFEFINNGSVDIRKLNYAEAKKLLSVVRAFCKNFKSKNRVNLPANYNGYPIYTTNTPFRDVEPNKYYRGLTTNNKYKAELMKEYNNYHQMSAHKKVKHLIRKILKIDLNSVSL